MIRTINLLLFFLAGINAQIALPTFQAVHTPHAAVAAVAESDSQTFSYTGAQQTFTVPSGVNSIQLKLWGAKGGYSYQSSHHGGYGGYATGTLSVSAGNTLYIYVGGAGEDSHTCSNTSATANGGWNNGGTANRSGCGGGGGGGGSDVRINGTSLNDRIIVAGGGGGAGYKYSNGNSQGGHGGGEEGGSGLSTIQRYGAPTGGTQSAGGDYASNSNYYFNGTFGVGAESNGWSWGGAAGGGGWYGGGSGFHSGAGGSGYVYTSSSHKPSGYDPGSQYYLTDTQLIGGDSTMPNPDGGTMTGRNGNGLIVIVW